MHFTIAQDQLKQGLAAAAAVIDAKPTLPVQANVLIEAQDGSVRFSGSNQDIGLALTVPAREVKTTGAITVSAKKLTEWVRELPDGDVTFSMAGDQRLAVECGAAKTKLVTLSSNEYPDFPSVPFGQGWTLPGKAVIAAVADTAFAVSTEESRPILNGVFWKWDAGGMEMVATNGHRLARNRSAVHAGGQGAVIVPPRALDVVSKHLVGDADVSVAKSDNFVGFQQGTLLVYARLIEGPYPNYEQVIPKEHDKTARFEKATLVAALKRMAVLASDQTKRIAITLGGGATAKFEAQTPNAGEATDETAVDYRGESLRIGFNSSYLLEILKHVRTDVVELQLTAPERAVLVLPVKQDGTIDGQATFLVMPLRLHD